MELLFTGGRILTMDGLDRIASGVAVRDGRIVAVGDSEELRKRVNRDAMQVVKHSNDGCHASGGVFKNGP